MDEKRLEELLAVEWQSIAAKVLKTALWLAARYGWNASSSLPNGKSVEDLVLEAIAELWADPSRIRDDLGLTAQLTSMVRSKLSNLATSADEDVTRSGELETVVVDRQKPGEEIVDDKDECAHAIAVLCEHPKVKGKEDHELVLMAISCGATEVEEIVKETGLPRERVYQVRREIRGLCAAIAGQPEDKREGRAIA